MEAHSDDTYRWQGTASPSRVMVGKESLGGAGRKKRKKKPPGARYIISMRDELRCRGVSPLFSHSSDRLRPPLGMIFTLMRTQSGCPLLAFRIFLPICLSTSAAPSSSSHSLSCSLIHSLFHSLILLLSFYPSYSLIHFLSLASLTLTRSLIISLSIFHFYFLLHFLTLHYLTCHTLSPQSYPLFTQAYLSSS